MKNSKIVLFLAAFVFVVGITGCEVESEKHEHTFSKKWTSNAIAHWHAATCEHKTEISGIAAHTFGEWKVTKEATEKQGGEKKRICSVCKYVDIAKLEHIHTFGEWAVTKEATESEEGERQRTCSACKYIEKETIAKLEHVHIFGSLTVIKEATELEDGLGKRTCSSCGYVEKVPICALNHIHKFSDKWTSDETEHWHIAICGHTEVSDKDTHKWDEKIIKAATCIEDGEKKLVCSVCNRTKTEVIPATGHSFATEWVSDATYHWHVATCEHSAEIGGKAEHTFGEWKNVQASTDSSQQERYRICDVCSYEDKRAVSHIIDKLVKVDGITINGNEPWSPKSKVFIEGRKLTIPSLYVSDHEITMREYKKVIENFELPDRSVSDADGKVYTKKDDKFLDAPIGNVSWFDAIVFCNKLSKKELLNPCYTINSSTDPADWGDVPTSTNSDNFDLWNKCECDFTKNGYRLPTDVEWEYLARGGQTYKYSGSDNLDEVGWYKDNSKTNNTPPLSSLKIVRLKTKNGYGLYDMSGNVEEWCWDFYKVNLSSEMPFEGPSSPEHSELRVSRGGNYTSSTYEIYQLVYGRDSYEEYVRKSWVGFRVVRTVTE